MTRSRLTLLDFNLNGTLDEATAGCCPPLSRAIGKYEAFAGKVQRVTR
jgi:hypothetical protein